MSSLWRDLCPGCLFQALCSLSQWGPQSKHSPEEQKIVETLYPVPVWLVPSFIGFESRVLRSMECRLMVLVCEK